MSTIGERILQIRGKMSQADFSKYTKINKSTLGRYERGTNQPSSTAIAAICKAFHINPAWLITGEGAVFSAGEDIPIETSELMGLDNEYIIDPDNDSDYMVMIIERMGKQYNYDIIKNIRSAYFEVLKEKRMKITKNRFDYLTFLLYDAFIELSSSTLPLVKPITNIGVRHRSYDLDGNLIYDNLNNSKK
jgi:transcriptional regulator with XRE-family HTH domain